ncbi:MAG TPA: DNA ligase, partial [Pseudonocardia sp.]|nr:DNA ligase [Pseudonocardia sp.]
LLERPFEQRRGTLERLRPDRLARVQLSPLYQDGPALLAAAAARGMAGVVAKRRHAPYRPGPSPDWVAVEPARSQSRGR